MHDIQFQYNENCSRISDLVIHLNGKSFAKRQT